MKNEKQQIPHLTDKSIFLKKKKDMFGDLIKPYKKNVEVICVTSVICRRHILRHFPRHWNLGFYDLPVIEVFGSVFKGKKIKHFKSQHLVSQDITRGRFLWRH